MKLLYFCTAIILACFSLVRCADKTKLIDCDKPAETFYKCLDKVFQIGVDDKKIKDCFENNNCTVTSWKYDGKIDQCKTGAKSIFETCLNDSNSQYFPKPKKDPTEPSTIPYVTPKDCKQASAVNKCIREVAFNHTERRQIFHEKCEAKAKCFNALPTKCQDLLNHTKNALCHCANETKELLKEHFHTCLNATKLPPGPGPEQVFLDHCRHDICAFGFPEGPEASPLKAGAPKGKGKEKAKPRHERSSML